jgi:hypothetical protein
LAARLRSMRTTTQTKAISLPALAIELGIGIAE